MTPELDRFKEFIEFLGQVNITLQFKETTNHSSNDFLRPLEDQELDLHYREWIDPREDWKTFTEWQAAGRRIHAGSKTNRFEGKSGLFHISQTYDPNET